MTFTVKGMEVIPVTSALRGAGLCALRIVSLFLTAIIAATFLIVVPVMMALPGAFLRFTCLALTTVFVPVRLCVCKAAAASAGLRSALMGSAPVTAVTATVTSLAAAAAGGRGGGATERSLEAAHSVSFSFSSGHNADATPSFTSIVAPPGTAILARSGFIFFIFLSSRGARENLRLVASMDFAFFVSLHGFFDFLRPIDLDALDCSAFLEGSPCLVSDLIEANMLSDFFFVINETLFMDCVA